MGMSPIPEMDSSMASNSYSTLKSQNDDNRKLTGTGQYNLN